MWVMRGGRSFTVDVAPDGEGLVSHAGAALLAEVADRVGLTRELRGALEKLEYVNRVMAEVGSSVPEIPDASEDDADVGDLHYTLAEHYHPLGETLRREREAVIAALEVPVAQFRPAPGVIVATQRPKVSAVLLGQGDFGIAIG